MIKSARHGIANDHLLSPPPASPTEIPTPLGFACAQIAPQATLPVPVIANRCYLSPLLPELGWPTCASLSPEMTAACSAAAIFDPLIPECQCAFRKMAGLLVAQFPGDGLDTAVKLGEAGAQRRQPDPDAVRRPEV